MGPEVTSVLVLMSAEGQRIVVRKAPFRIGRHADNDLTLLSPELSSFHAELRFADNAWSVVDIGSTNGTYLNGEPVAAGTPLCTGDALHLGASRFQISFASSVFPSVSKTRELGRDDTLQAAIELARVIAQERVVSHFQPLVALESDEVLGWEALARPGSKMPGGPAALLALAEAHNQASNVGALFAHAAVSCVTCHHCWADRREPPLLFLNVHPQQLIDGSLPALLAEREVQALRQRYRLVVEIPEELACETDEMASWVADLRQSGFGVAYDDFGKGQSRITELLAVPPDYVKLDRALITDLGEQPTKRKLVQAVIEACQALQVRTIAEGIETEAEARACRELGVDIGQGYLLARPSPAYHLFGADTAGLPESCPFRRFDLLG